IGGDWGRYDYGSLNVRPLHMTGSEMLDGFRFVYSGFYSVRSMLRRFVPPPRRNLLESMAMLVANAKVHGYLRRNPEAWGTISCRQRASDTGAVPIAWRGRPAYTPPHGRNRDALSHLLALRGHLRAPDHHSRPGDRGHPGRRSRSAERRLHLPQGTGAAAPARGSRPVAPSDDPPWLALGAHRLGRRVRRDRRPASRTHAPARARCRRRLPREPVRPPALAHALPARAASCARHAERVLGEHRRSDAQAGERRAHVRDGPHGPGARSRPHPLPAPPRR